MEDKERQESFGESGLRKEDIEDFIVYPDSDTEQEIVGSVVGHGFKAELSRDALFREYYRMVSEGPGRCWTPAHRASFALQTMHRMGVIEWPEKSLYGRAERAKRSRSSEGPEHTEKSESSENFAPPRREPPAQDCTKELFGYRPLSRDEIKDNLIVVAGVAGIVLLAAVGVTVDVATGSVATDAGIGGASVAVFCAAASRLASHWHTRFTRKYRLVRLLVCLTLLFSGTAWLAAKETWKVLCTLAGTEISIPSFGLSLFGLMAVIGVASHIKLCRIYDPRTAKTLGWLEALAAVFAIGALLFVAINKP